MILSYEKGSIFMTFVKIKKLRSFELLCIMALSICLAGIFFASNSIRSVSAIPETLPPQVIIENSGLITFCSLHGSGSGTSSSPYLIQDKTINASSVTTCFLLRNTNKYVTFKNCTFSNSGNTGYTDTSAGLCLENCSHVNVTGCHVFNNIYGIVLNMSTYVTIEKSNVSANNGQNLYVYKSNDTVISGNQLNHSLYNDGIFVPDNCHNLTIIDNHVSNNDNKGIEIDSNHMLNDSLIQGNNVTFNIYGGLDLTGYNNRVIGNNFSRSTGSMAFGINMNAVKNTTHGNIIESNDASYDYAYGLSISDNCRGNIIAYNRFSNETNNDGGLYSSGYEAFIVGYDYYGPPHVLNTWDDGTVGNYWGDYTAVTPGASTSNGVTWNTIYNITSQSGWDSKSHRGILDADNHPLVHWPYTTLVAPHLNPPTHSTSTDGNITLTWIASSGATSYKLFRYTSTITVLNISVTLVGTFTSTSATDKGLVNGTYYYVVVALNLNSNSPISNCVKVIVAIPPSQSQSPSGPPSPPGIPGFDGIWLTIFAGIGMAIVRLKKRDKFVA